MFTKQDMKDMKKALTKFETARHEMKVLDRQIRYGTIDFGDEKKQIIYLIDL